MMRCAALLVMLAALLGECRGADVVTADVVIFGGTPAGLAAGIAASREGCTVVVIEPTPWIGGVVTGGLSRTDTGREEVIGGLAREFFRRAAESSAAPLWFAEPRSNMATFKAMVAEAGLQVITGQSVESVAVDGRRITSLTTRAGNVHAGRVFIDASYEGDLMALAGVSCIVGRESVTQYGEPLAGFHPMPIRPRSPAIMESDCPDIGGTGPAYIHGTPAAISALDDAGEPIAGVRRSDAVPGSADGLTQAYNYRLCVTQRADIVVPFPRPRTYSPERYELLLRLIKAFPGVRFGRLFHLGRIAGDKFDLNAQGLFSTDLPGGSVEYPSADPAVRDRIRRDHADFIQGMLWFLGHDDRVPEDLRAQTNSWGLCKDEFVDNGHWPYALYVREGRRMVGDYVLVQRDLQEDVFKEDSVGMGSFLIDCHIVQRLVGPDGTVRDEGSFADEPVLPYQIPYRSLTPKPHECENLLVPVCLSASHIACCSLRMEPVYMTLGHAAGVAAALALRESHPVQEIDHAVLRQKLIEQGAVVELASVAAMPRSKKLPGIVMDEQVAERVGLWKASPFGNPVDGMSRHDDNAGKGSKSVRYTLRVPRSGRYEVRLAYTPAPNRAAAVPVTVDHAMGSARVSVNQRIVPPLDGLFVTLGTYEFSSDAPAIITVSNTDTDGFVNVDAVQLLDAG